MNIKSLIQKNRSYRRFHQEKTISNKTLVDLVDLARLSASGANLQPLKFILSCTPERNEKIFSTLAWAGYLKDWTGPAEGEKPAAYIIILGDSNITKSFGCDQGIAAQSILLGAVEKGWGGCILGSIQRKELREKLQIPSQLEILLVIALGKPAEKVEIETSKADGNIKYWRDEKDVHHVPKRPLEEIIVD
ncbi:MAG: nitroreductase family protein [bacterium]